MKTLAELVVLDRVRPSNVFFEVIQGVFPPYTDAIPVRASVLFFDAAVCKNVTVKGYLGGVALPTLIASTFFYKIIGFH